jgi:hypothetical protein
MADRLKQIWGGFEKTTTRHLTGRGVDNIEIPRRSSFRDGPVPAPKDVAAPAEAAFAALRHRLTAAGARAAKQEARRLKAETQSDAPPPADGAEAPDSVRNLLAGLKSTEMRTMRPEADYATFVAQNPKAAPRLTPRKKLFGIF